MKLLTHSIHLPSPLYNHVPGIHILCGFVCLSSGMPLVIATGIGAIIYGLWVIGQRRG